MNKALIIIDMQEAYFKTPRLIARKDQLVENINRLYSEYRHNDDMVINVRTIHSPNKQTWTLNMLEDDQGFAFEGSDEIANVAGLDVDGAVEIIKTRDSAFHDTQLRQILTNHGVTSITLTGVSTHSCIFQTASDAYAYNIVTAVATDAVADEDETHHRQALNYLAREYRMSI